MHEQAASVIHQKKIHTHSGNADAMAKSPSQTELPQTEQEEVNKDLVRSVLAAIDDKSADTLKDLVGELHESTMADLLENLPAKKRNRFVKLMGDDFKVEVLPELEEPVLAQIVEDMPNEQVADAVRQLDSDDAVYLIEELEEADKDNILEQIPEVERAPLERSLEYPEDSAGRLMQAEFIAVPPFWSVGQTIDYMRETTDLPNSFSEIYIINADFHLVGMVPLDRLLRTGRPIEMNAIMNPDVQLIEASLDQEEVARQFERYNLLSAPVVDEDQRLLGVITIDDVVDVIQEEAEEDIHRMGGVGDEALSDSVLNITKSRFTWLLVNLFTAILASLVINMFDATINEKVALAVLMTVVASMGGNAATQTMTVSVRALATKELTPVNAFRVVSREGLVGLLNGLMFALVTGVVTLIWFQSLGLAAIMAAAMVFNMLVAGLSGILIPMVLEKYNIDPAVASSVFVTTVTDVVGFFSFLGLAALFLV